VLWSVLGIGYGIVAVRAAQRAVEPAAALA
jgi:hypothetical protein